MSHFIDDVPAAPTAKEDLPGRPIVGLAKNNYTAPEWNAIWQALVDTRDRVIDALAGGAAAPLIYGEAYDASVSPTLLTNLGTPLEILTYTHPTSLAAATVVQACASGSCYSPNGASTAGIFEFYFTVNGGSPIQCATRYMSTTNYQTVWSGTRLLTLPAGTPVIRLFVKNVTGSVTQMGFNADNFLGFTYQG